MTTCMLPLDERSSARTTARRRSRRHGDRLGRWSRHLGRIVIESVVGVRSPGRALLDELSESRSPRG